MKLDDARHARNLFEKLDYADRCLESLKLEENEGFRGHSTPEDLRQPMIDLLNQYKANVLRKIEDI